MRLSRAGTALSGARIAGAILLGPGLGDGGPLRGALPRNIPENQELPCDLSDDLDLYFI